MDRASQQDDQQTFPVLARRDFFKTSLGAGALALLAGGGDCRAPRCAAAAEHPKAPLAAVEAGYYEKLKTGAVRCRLEPRECHIEDGERGFCGVRENRKGTYYSLTYGRPCVVRVAPIEENFMHVLPGATALNVGTAGCNLQCQFCNTYQISQARPEDTPNQSLTPAQLVERASAEGCSVICFTDNEPVVCFEYLVDTAKAARKAGLKTVCHTAGQIFPEPAKELAQVLDAVTVDLKAVTNEVYKKLTMVPLDAIIEAIKTFAAAGLFVEVASPLITKFNDPPDFATAAAQYILSAAGPQTPWQLLRYFPSYNMLSGIATPLRAMHETRKIARAAGLKYVYLCNVFTEEGQDVKCEKCGRTVVKREDDEVHCRWKTPGVCPKCGMKIPGVWT